MSRPRQRRRDPKREGQWRIRALAFLVLGLFAVAAFRSVCLQVFQASELQARAEDQRIRRLELLPDRGAIFDRNGRELAQSIPGASVFVDPSALLDRREDLGRLCKTLDLDPGEARALLSRGGARFAWLKRRVTPSVETAVRRLEIPGVGIAREPHRYFPKKGLAGQVLGFVGTDGRGLGGIEYRYDGLLRGRSRSVQAERDARGCLLLTDAPDLRKGQGQNVTLTLDETVQHIVEEELGRAVEESAARGGIAVVLEPATGEILALAQVPAFNPNIFGDSAGEDRKIKAVVDVYEPGSTLKTLFLGILLDRGLAKPSDLVFCENGEWTVHRRTIHDHVPHGWLTVADVLKVSSNIGVAKLSEKLREEDLYEGLRRFGLGERTGVELPGESNGILPPTRTWSKMTPKTMAYGQGVSATALQVASAVAAIANGGLRMRPRLVRAIQDAERRHVEHFEPQLAGRALSERTAATVTHLMERVVQDEKGTGTLAAVPGYTVAGKTGTSWKPDPDGNGYLRNKVVASFAGFVPSRAPRITLLVAVDEPSRGSRYGGMVAAPAFREMARRILAYLGVPPSGETRSTETGITQAAPPRKQRREVATGTMPDLRGLTMREVLRALAGWGAAGAVNLLGSGVAASQDPSPGTPLADGQGCRVVFRPLL